MDRLENVLCKAQILNTVCEYISNLSDVYNVRMHDYSEKYAHYISDGIGNDYMLTEYAKNYAESEVKFDTLQTLYSILQNYDF